MAATGDALHGAPEDAAGGGVGVWHERWARVRARLRIPDRPWLPPSWGDLGIGALVVLITVAATLLRPRGASPDPAWYGLAAAIACTMPLMVRRRWPIAVLVAALVGSTIAGIGHVDPPAALTVPVALYTVAKERGRDVAPRAFGAAVVAGLATSLVLGRPGLMDYLVDAARGGVLYVASLLLGLYMATRAAYVAALVERAEALERGRALATRQAVAAERARIARELHDVVAHHVSVIAMQAGAVRAIAPVDPPEVTATLESIRTTAREALVEMRRMLTVLREESPAVAGDGGASDWLEPQPGLADVPRLVERVRQAGMEVLLEMPERPANLPPGVDLSAYRIIQEALTNSLRHAGPNVQARVTVTAEPKRLCLEVVDDGRGPAAPVGQPGDGRGLVGMHERVVLLGGVLHVGPGPAGGFRVSATIPLDGSASMEDEP